MDITPANLSIFFTALETRWSTAFETTETWSEKVASTYPVNTERWTTGWRDPTGPMTEWTGERNVEAVGLETYTVVIQNFQKTLGVDQFKLADDTHGIYFNLAQDFAVETKKWPDYQLRDLILGLNSQSSTARQLGIDGISHWNTAHPVDFFDASKGNYSNDFRGGMSVGGVTVGGALGVNPFNTLWQEFANRKKPNGQAMGLEPDLTMVPSQLKATAVTLLQSQFFAPATMGNLTGQVGSLDNPLKGWTDLFINKDLQSTSTLWWMLVTKYGIKPFSWLLRQSPDFVARIRPDDPAVFDLHTYLFGSMSRGAPAWSFPWLSAISGP